MDLQLPLDQENLSAADPSGGIALAAGAETLKSKDLRKIATAEDYEALPHGARYLDPEGNQRFKPIRNREDWLGVEEGAEYADPEGNIRTKPKYESIDYTAQTLYDIAHSDKGRKMALERSYPGKVREDPAGGFYIEDEGGKLRKPGRGISSVTGFLTSEALPAGLGALGSVVGGAAGTAATPGVGTALGGVAGAAIGGAYGTRFNQLVSQLAGVYDPEGATENVVMSGVSSAAGDVGGRALFAAAPLIKEGARQAVAGAAKTANKFLGTNAGKLEIGLPIAEAGEQAGKGPFGLSKPGTAVSPSAIFESSPHLTNVAEILQQKFDRSDTYLANAEKYMDKRAKDILASKDIGSIVEGSLVHPTAAVPTEKAGILLKESAQAKAVQQSAEADARLQAELANRRAAVEAKHAPDIEAHRARNSQVVQTAEQAKTAANTLVQEGFQAIDKQANDALKVAKAGYNSGDLWRTVAKSFVDLRASIQSRATKMYGDAETAAGGLVPPGSNGLAGPAEQLLAELPQGFESLHPSIVRKLRDIAGVRDPASGEWIKEPADATWVQLHNLRSQIRQDIKWNDLTSDVRNGTLKFLDKKINEVLHPIEEGKGYPSIASAATQYKGKTYTGAIHPDAVIKLAKDLGEDVSTDEKFSEFYTKHYEDMLEGFLTSEGKFVSRTEASDIADRAAQYKAGKQDRKLDALDIEMSGAEKSSPRFSAVEMKPTTIGGGPPPRRGGPSIQEASRLLKLADAFYRENMGPLNQQQLKALVRALDVGGIQADPKALLKLAIRDGQTEVAETIKKTVGPQTWDALRAADVKEMLAQSAQIGGGDVDGVAFARQVLDRKRNGVLEVLHGKEGAARLEQQAAYVEALRGKLDIKPRPGDTVNDIILRARAAAADAENLAKADPLKALANEMKKVEAATRKEFAAKQKPDPLGFLTNATVGANAAVDKLLGDPDLIVAAARAFPGGENSPEFQLMRQIWTERFLRETLEPGEKLAATSPEIQALMFPGVTLDDMHMLAKEMKVLMSGATMRGGGDMGGSIMAQSAVENPVGHISGLGKLAGPIKAVPAFNFGARAVLTAYYNTVRGLLTSPSTLRWLRKGLQSRDPVARMAARAELQAAIMKGGAMGAATGTSLHQYSQEPDQGVME